MAAPIPSVDRVLFAPAWALVAAALLGGLIGGLAMDGMQGTAEKQLVPPEKRMMHPDGLTFEQLPPHIQEYILARQRGWFLAKSLVAGLAAAAVSGLLVFTEALWRRSVWGSLLGVPLALAMSVFGVGAAGAGLSKYAEWVELAGRQPNVIDTLVVFSGYWSAIGIVVAAGLAVTAAGRHAVAYLIAGLLGGVVTGIGVFAAAIFVMPDGFKDTLYPTHPQHSYSQSLLVMGVGALVFVLVFLGTAKRARSRSPYTREADSLPVASEDASTFLEEPGS